MIREEVPDALSGERLDRLVAMLTGCSRSEASRLIADGGVRVNDKVITKSSFRLDQGVVVAFEAPEAAEPVPPVGDPAIRVPVIHADEHVLVVDKPVGLVVHPGAGNPDATMINGLLADFPELADVGDPLRPGIVHRLDRGTSGLLIVARTQPAYEALVAALAERTIERHYETLVWGRVDDDRGVVDAPIGRSTARRTRMTVTAAGRDARTHYEVIERREHRPVVTWLGCRLETGRTHQIRVHLRAIGHNVVGDDLYGGVRQSIKVDRPMLHARRLVFAHPVTGERHEFASPLPEDFVGVLADLDLGSTMTP